MGVCVVAEKLSSLLLLSVLLMLDEGKVLGMAEPETRPDRLNTPVGLGFVVTLPLQLALLQAVIEADLEGVGEPRVLPVCKVLAHPVELGVEETLPQSDGVQQLEVVTELVEECEEDVVKEGATESNREVLIDRMLVEECKLEVHVLAVGKSEGKKLMETVAQAVEQ